jgi:hypothetical protein
MVDFHTLGADIVREFAREGSAWGLSVGLVGIAGRVIVDYELDGREVYSFRTDRAFSGGVRLGGTCAVRLIGPLGITAAGGLQAVTGMSLKSKNLEWWWQGSTEGYRAALQSSGVYGTIGAGLVI